MAKINLRKYYPNNQTDTLIEVSEHLNAQFQQWDREEMAYLRRRNRNRAFYSLDRGDGIENESMLLALSMEELLESKVIHEQLYEALSTLHVKQAKRIYAHFILGMSQAEIAEAEHVSRVAIRLSLVKGLKNLRRFFEELHK